MSALVVGIVLDSGREEGVDESRLSQPGFASNLGHVSICPLQINPPTNMPTMIVKAAPLFATILCLWLGRFAIPTTDALSAAGGAIVRVGCSARLGLKGCGTDSGYNHEQLGCDTS